MEAADLKFENGKFTEDELEQAIIELFQQQDAGGVRWSYANGAPLRRAAHGRPVEVEPSTPLCRY